MRSKKVAKILLERLVLELQDELEEAYDEIEELKDKQVLFCCCDCDDEEDEE